MKKSKFTRIISLVLCSSLLLTACQNTKTTSKKYAELPNDSEIITMGKAADYLLSEASKYNKNLPKKEELLDNFLGLQEKDNAPRMQILSMVSRAFGPLPKPTGNNARLASEKVDLSSVPQWWRDDLENLKTAGILAPSDLQTESDSDKETSSAATQEIDTTDSASDNSQSETLTDTVETDSSSKTASSNNAGAVDNLGSSNDSPSFESKDTMTGKELKTIVRRIYALYGSNQKDDFYAAINKKELDTKEIPAGETDAGGTYDQTIHVQNQIHSIIKKIVEGDNYTPGSMEDKIKTFYESAVNFEKRNALGAEPLRKYMDAIDNASSMQELSNAQMLSAKELACGSFFTILYMTDPRDPQKTIATLNAPIEPMNSEDDKDHLIRLLVLTGESEEEAAAHVNAYLTLEKELGSIDAAPSDPQYVTPEELEAMFPGQDVNGIITANGDTIPKEFCLQMPVLFKECQKFFQNEAYLPALKTALKLQIVTTTYTFLSKDFLDAFDEYEQQSMGQAASNQTFEEIAYAMVENTLGDYIDRLYAEQYFSKEAKKSVEDMIEQFIKVYKKRIEKLDWMSSETKKAAKEKLDSMKFFIGYPDQWSNRLEQLEITDNYFQNQINAQKLFQQAAREEAAAQNAGTATSTMKIPVATVNAYYDQYSNTMCFPAGILQAPAFDVNASFEENLGGIGTTIAHEITHAFDNTGAKFDANGLQKNWWSSTDYEHFQTLCKKASDFYDGWESAPGISISGEQTLGENIADIGGVACALDVLKETKNPDYDKFFSTYAKNWLKCTTRPRAESLSEVDEHSPSNLRVNRVLANFQEFYDTYQIKPNDGMYVPLEERIHIW